MRNPSNPISQSTFSISEENPAIVKKKIQPLEEEIKENEEILKTLKEEKEEVNKESEEHFAVIEKEHDPAKDLINKIIEVDHDEPEENVDDYFSKLEQE